MSKKRWFRFYIDQWRNGTFGLSPNEIAAYIEILCELYDHDGFARLNVPIMSRRCGMRPTSFQAAVDRLVAAGKIDLQGGLLTNKAVSEEIKSREKLGEKSVKSRENLAGKRNQINGSSAKIAPYREDRIQKGSTTSKVSRLCPPDFSDEQITVSDALTRALGKRFKH